MVSGRQHAAPQFLSAGLLLLTAASGSAANVFSADGSDPRRFVERDDAAWRSLLPVGMVSADFALRKTKTIGTIAAGGGTAFMVSPCYAMTSYHVLFGGTDLVLDPMANYPVTVRFGLAGADGPLRTVRGSVQYWGSATGSDPDLALIRLDGCPGATLGWYALPVPDDRRLLPAMALAMASVSRDRGMTRMSLQRGCAVQSYLRRRGWLLHDCATRQGASGAPIVAGLDGIPLVIGVNAGEFNAAKGVLRAFDAGHANWAVATIAIGQTSRLRSMIGHDLHRAQVDNPLATGER